MPASDQWTALICCRTGLGPDPTLLLATIPFYSLLPEFPHLHDVLAGDPAHQLWRCHPQQQGLPSAELHQAAAG